MIDRNNFGPIFEQPWSQQFFFIGKGAPLTLIRTPFLKNSFQKWFTHVTFESRVRGLQIFQVMPWHAIDKIKGMKFVLIVFIKLIG